MISWQACYKNGDVIKLGPNVKYDTLNRHGLEAFQIIFKNFPILTIHLYGTRQLIYRRRTEQDLKGNKIVCHIAGWKEQDHDDTLLYIFERTNGPFDVFPEIHLSGKFDRERNRFFYPPQYREFEKGEGTNESKV